MYWSLSSEKNWYSDLPKKKKPSHIYFRSGKTLGYFGKKGNI